MKTAAEHIERIESAIEESAERAASSAERGWSPPRRPPFAPAECRLPPLDREHNHAAEQLHVILVEDAFDALVSAAADEGIRDAVARLLEAIAEARR